MQNQGRFSGSFHPGQQSQIVDWTVSRVKTREYITKAQLLKDTQENYHQSLAYGWIETKRDSAITQFFLKKT
jgi:hypothetical protein